MHSMQKIVELMKEYAEFGPQSRFIDVGSGLGKPNLYVAQNPGVEFSFGIEVEHVRNVLGLHNLQHVLLEAKKFPDYQIGTNCVLQHGNITEATTFDPFTHVYMFDIGFPPSLFDELAEMFNRSKHSKYLICFHGPRLIIEDYGFDVELLKQIPTSMHGSKEIHSGYVYKRKYSLSEIDNLPTKIPLNEEEEVCCDPLFQDAYGTVKKGLNAVLEVVKEQIDKDMSAGRPRRSRKQIDRF